MTTANLLSPRDLEGIDLTRIPQHIAVIPDGNRRWARQHSKTLQEGYNAAAQTVINSVQAAQELGVRVLTVYAFSTENWSRPLHEREVIFFMIASYLEQYAARMAEMGVRLHTIGGQGQLPERLTATIAQAKASTAHCKAFDLVLAINYGARNELVRAVQSLAARGITAEALTEELLSQELDTRHWPDPDLLIRTSGEQRLSNFLLWQCAYTELVHEPVTWPHFTPQHLLAAVYAYQQRERRRGGGLI